MSICAKHGMLYYTCALDGQREGVMDRMVTMSKDGLGAVGYRIPVTGGPLPALVAYYALLPLPLIQSSGPTTSALNI